MEHKKQYGYSTDSVRAFIQTDSRSFIATAASKMEHSAMTVGHHLHTAWAFGMRQGPSCWNGFLTALKERTAVWKDTHFPGNHVH